MEFKEVMRELLSAKEAKQGLHVDMIAQQILMSGYDCTEDLGIEEIKKKANQILLSESRKPKGLFAKVINPKTKRPKKGIYKLVVRRGDKPELPTIADEPNSANPGPKVTSVPSSNYIGKGGEYAVMSELLFNGYNANTMTVDEGIDIVASKHNLYYYIQVKTTNLSAGHNAHVQIKRSSFDRGMSHQVRYFVVVRCGKGEIRYFQFSEKDINGFAFNHLINMNSDVIYINIVFDPEDHRPYLQRDGKRCDISFYQNNFDL